MKFYTVNPKDEYSSSRRWVVDFLTLSSLEEHYRNYPTENGGSIDRWADFLVTEIYNIHIDLGGMLCITDPEVSFKLYNTKFTMTITHLPHFINILENDQYIKDNILKLKLMYHYHNYSQETRKLMLDACKKLFELKEEMVEGYEKNHNDIIDKINKNYLKIIRKRNIE